MDTNTVIRKINGGKGAALIIENGKADEVLLAQQRVLNDMLISNNARDRYFRKKYSLWEKDKDNKEKLSTVVLAVVKL